MYCIMQNYGVVKPWKIWQNELCNVIRQSFTHPKSRLLKYIRS